MFSHITIGTRDLGTAAAFYDAVLNPLGLRRRTVIADAGPAAACWVSPGRMLPRFYVYMPFNSEPATPGNGSMVAFLAPQRSCVDQAYEAALRSGGSDEGPPGERVHYGDGYYGAYLRDPDGNKVHIAFRGDLLAPPDGLPKYRVLTGKDDASFCHRVSEAIALGYQAHGSPAITFKGQDVIVAQAMLWPGIASPDFTPSP